MLLVDDYDCYNLQLKHTRQLNHLFWNYQGDRVSKFVERFKHGFDKFTDDEQSIIEFYEKKIQRVISELNTFHAEIPVFGETYKFASTFATECINDVADHIINHNNVDVGIVVNKRSNKVSFRKKKGVDLDLSQLAKKICNGGGHKYAAGGALTSTFLTFSKLFKPIK
jgi:oligoribonuclease NrnB/cAMP/cGMP phosphodiesterase (DHH superfamily)